MARIVLILEDVGPRKSEIIKRLKALTPIGITEATTAIANGQPVLDRQIFDRHSERFASQVLDFLEWLESQALQYKAYQVLNHDIFDPCRSNEYYVISAGRLRTMITTRNSSIEEQRRIGRFQEGADE